VDSLRKTSRLSPVSSSPVSVPGFRLSPVSPRAHQQDGSLTPPSRPSEIALDHRTVLARKGPLRRTEAARPCALRAVLSGWFRDGRLRRDELRSSSLRPKTRTQIRRESVYTDCLTPPKAPLPKIRSPWSSTVSFLAKPRRRKERQQKDPLCDSAPWRETVFRNSVDSVDGVPREESASGMGTGAVHFYDDAVLRPPVSASPGAISATTFQDLGTIRHQYQTPLCWHFSCTCQLRQ